MTMMAGIIVIVLVILLVVLGIGLRLRRRRQLKPARFQDRWQALQKNCAQKATWPLAIIEADNLLDDALKRSRFKGKTTGERLVAAQRKLTSNESVWFGHKLRNRMVHEDASAVEKRDMLQALGGFRQALRDLGALERNGGEASDE